jgi:hypothetical protein
MSYHQKANQQKIFPMHMTELFTTPIPHLTPAAPTIYPSLKPI